MERVLKEEKCREGIVLLTLALIGVGICIWLLKTIITRVTLSSAATSNQLQTTGGMVVSVDHLSTSKEGKYFVTFTLADKEGIPQEAQHIISAWVINVEANGKKYRLLQKKASQEVHITEKTEKKLTYVEEARLCKKVNNKWTEVQENISGISGKTGYLSAGTFHLYSENQILKDDITRYLNTEEVPKLTTFTKVGLTERGILEGNKAEEEARWLQEQSNLYKPTEILESQGLNAPVYTEPDMLLDSIGFVNGRLHLITSKAAEGELYFIVTDQQGKKVSTVYSANYGDGLEYQVVDIDDLTGCKLEAIQYISYGEEKTPALDLKVPFEIVVEE